MTYFHQQKKENEKNNENENDNIEEAVKNTMDDIFNFNSDCEEEKENSSFSFKNDLLNKNVYNFLKKKDECLAAMVLDDSIPTKN